MILDHDDSDGVVGRVTLDQVFRRMAERKPDSIALAGPAGGTHVRLAYAQADRAVSALAARLASLGLPQDSVVAVQGGASPLMLVAILAIGRAGLVAMPMPDLWRDMELRAAVEGAGVRALLSCEPGGDQSLVHCRVASEVFQVRFVCALADEAIDGVIPIGGLDTLLASGDEPPALQRTGNPADHVAVLTWDTGADGPFPVPRSHRALVAGGMPSLLEGRLDDGATILTTVSLTSFAGLAAAAVPALLTGGTLVVEPPFDPLSLSAALEAERVTHLLVPAEVAPALVAEGVLDHATELRTLLLLSRQPEAAPPDCPSGERAVVDIAAIGEAALVARRRDGAPARAALPSRRASARGDGAGIRASRTLQGTLVVTGAMVPGAPWPSPAGHRLPLDAEGALDTGWSCQMEPDGMSLACVAPPRGVALVGGCRVSLRDTEAKLSAMLGVAVDVAALPHRVLGQRIVASAETTPDEATRDRLSPLIGLGRAMTALRRSAG